jgi:hypothetical protein
MSLPAKKSQNLFGEEKVQAGDQSAPKKRERSQKPQGSGLMSMPEKVSKPNPREVAAKYTRPVSAVAKPVKAKELTEKEAKIAKIK